MFDTFSHCHPSLVFAGLARGKPFTELTLMVGSQPCLSKIRLGWKLLALANTLAYYSMASFTEARAVGSRVELLTELTLMVGSSFASQILD